MEQKIKCTKCGSEQVTAVKKGFSGGKAAAGAVLTGGIGLLAGFHGSGDIQVACLACGNKWSPKKLAETTRREETAAKIEAHSIWKQRFYEAYEDKDFEKAAMVYTQMYAFEKTPDVHAIYKLHKKSDRMMTVIYITLVAIAVTILYFILRN